MKAKLFSLVLFLGILVTSCNKLPTVPEAIYPNDGAINITKKNITLEWSATDPEGKDLVYNVLFGEDTLDGTLLSEHQIAKGIKSTTIEVRNLKDSTKYIWVVEAIDLKGHSSLKIFSFSTGILQ